MEDKVLCPCCGNEMKLNHHIVEFGVLEGMAKGRFECTNEECAAYWRTGWSVARSEEELREFLIASVNKKPLQKPLPWAEVIERGKHPNSIVWIETGMMLSSYIQSGWYELLSVSRADSDGRYHFTGKIELYRPGFHDPYILSILLYEKEVRCWATKPTEEERQAAEWITN